MCDCTRIIIRRNTIHAYIKVRNRIIYTSMNCRSNSNTLGFSARAYSACSRELHNTYNYVRVCIYAWTRLMFVTKYKLVFSVWQANNSAGRRESEENGPKSNKRTNKTRSSCTSKTVFDVVRWRKCSARSGVAARERPEIACATGWFRADLAFVRRQNEFAHKAQNKTKRFRQRLLSGRFRQRDKTHYTRQKRRRTVSGVLYRSWNERSVGARYRVCVTPMRNRVRIRMRKKKSTINLNNNIN